jgi:hypothetical protein
MSEAADFRVWADRLASKAGKEPDPDESQRLMSIVEYWKRLADLDDWERDGSREASLSFGSPRCHADRHSALC